MKDRSWSSSGSEESVEEDDGDEEERGNDPKEGSEREEVEREEGGRKDEEEGQQLEVVGSKAEVGKEGVEGVGGKDNQSHCPGEDLEDEECCEVRADIEPV